MVKSWGKYAGELCDYFRKLPISPLLLSFVWLLNSAYYYDQNTKKDKNIHMHQSITFKYRRYDAKKRTKANATLLPTKHKWSYSLASGGNKMKCWFHSLPSLACLLNLQTVLLSTLHVCHSTPHPLAIYFSTNCIFNREKKNQEGIM